MCDKLGDVSHKWREIGVQLGIPYNKLKQFEKEADPLAAAIDYWLKGNTGIPVLWKSIHTALKSGHVGEQALAEEISKIYCWKNIEG